MLKSDAKEEFGRSLEAKGNYSFGGRTPIVDKRKNGVFAKAFIDTKGTLRMSSGNPERSLKTFSGAINPFENIYELVQ